MAEKKWTPQQSDAINSRGGTVLVSAAAGSGKTAVLVQRVIERILDKDNPTDADKLLVVTFSNAAAGEMRERITSSLMKMSDENPSDMRLKRQILLMDKAHISTVHSFCLELIRDNFHTLGISPDFRIADENELKIMTRECLSDCVEYFYDNDSDGRFCDLASLVSGARDDRKLNDTILRLYSFLRSHPFYNDWMQEKLSYYSDEESVENSIFGKTILEYAKNALNYAESVCDGILKLIAGDEKLEKAYMPAVSSDTAFVKRCIDILKSVDSVWDKLYCELKALKFAPLGRLTKYEDESKKERVKDLRERVKDILEELQKLFECDGAQYREDMKTLYPTVEKLFEITSFLSDRMDKLKRERRMIDFSDMEHMALSLLIKKEDGAYVKTELAREVSEQFDEVLVDECQDTNETQEMIFSAVSKDGDNLFFVGDVKQSIYRFRQAMPELFLEKSDTYAKYDGETYPAKIVLDRNFRSRKEITDAVNFFFSQIMSRELGEVDYSEEESLVSGAVFPEAQNRGCEVIFIDSSDSDDKQKTEAEFIAAEIKKLIESGYQVNDNGTMRPVCYRDIAVLMRSPSARSTVFTEAMKSAGIPSWADISTGFSENAEVSAVMSLLRAVDNPLLDIPLAAALMSDMFMFSEDEIAQIRLFSRGEPLYVCLTKMENEKAADEKICEFLKKFRVFRTLSTIMPADRLIRRIYDMTLFVQSVQARPDSQDRRENLFLLTEYAAKYEKMGYRGLSGFVRFMDDLALRETDLAPAVTFSDSADVVKIMSIHRSKGLEFPIVFIVDTAKLFNKEDLKNTVLLHSSLGFACVARDLKTMSQYKTVPYNAVKLKSESAGLSEEMRVLYVAMTRAKEKMYITSCSDSPQKRLYSLCASLDEETKLPPYLVQNASSYMDWIMMCCARHPDAVGIRAAAGLYENAVIDDKNRMIIRIEKPQSADLEVSENENEFVKPDKKLTESLKKRFEYKYPYEEATKLPSKLGVSELTKRELERSFSFSREPSFLSGKSMSGAQRGQAMHTFLQFADYRRAAQNCADEIERMAALKYITRKQADAVSVKKLESFFASDLYRRIEKADRVWRELAFIHKLPAKELGYGDIDETVTVQGVADCIFEENGVLIVVDYKTDYVSDISELSERYGAQLKMYKKLVSMTLNKPVRECIIYSLSLSEQISID